MGLVTIGLESIEIAPLASDGGPGTVFVKFGNTATDSLSFDEADPSIKEVNVEESDAPIYEFKTRGKLSIKLNISDPDADCYATIRGGAVTTGTGTKTYADADTFSNVERTVKITAANGFVFTINRASLSGLISGGLGKNQELYLALTATALQPTKTGVKIFTALQATA